MRLLAISVLILTACSTTTAPNSKTLPPLEAGLTGNSSQLIVVVSDHWDATQGQLYSFEKMHNRWQTQPMTGAVTLGKKGLAWGLGLHPVQSGLQKTEGDGRAPAGLFTLSGAFGYATTLETAMPYQAMQADDFCIDVATSPLYNQTVDRRKFQLAWTANSTEPMRRDLHLNGDQAYQQGLFIDHNPKNIAGAGSCIFMHLWQSPDSATAGCTAMAKPQLSALLRWLDPAKKPLYLLLPKQQYLLLTQAWQLPELPPTP
jgi:L,D-peptidoglycan transpeptidase YkuD (ErfK/YbiS/YcfS/YnhG family)